MLTRETFKIARIFTEFPWLSKHLSPDGIKDISISRFDSRTMNDCIGVIGRKEEILLLDRNGDIVEKVRPAYGPIRMFFKGWLGRLLYDDGIMDKNESIVSTLMRIGESESGRIVFALEIRDGRCGTAIVYKMPRAFPTMTSWIAELHRRAGNAVRQEIAAIDADGIKS